jgi:hypothetical protein
MKKLLFNANLSESLTSPFINIESKDVLSVNVSWSGNQVKGTLYIELSGDDKQFTPVITKELDKSNGNFLSNVKRYENKFIRIRYVPENGTGYLNVNIGAV